MAACGPNCSPEKSAPNSTSTLSTATHTLEYRVATTAKAAVGGRTTNPPRWWISLSVSAAAPTERIAPAARDSSYQLSRSRTSPPVRPDHTDHHQRYDSLVQDKGIGDLHPGQQDRHQDRNPPARPHPIKDQPDHHHRDLGSGVVGARQQCGAARSERRREHDPGRDQHPDRALAPGRVSPGQQRSTEHEQRVGHRRGDVHDIGVQPVGEFHQRVLRQLGGVKRQVRGRPAPQQHVAMQHVPGLQRERSPVRDSRDGLRLPEVGREQGHARRGEPGRPGPPARPGDAVRACEAGTVPASATGVSTSDPPILYSSCARRTSLLLTEVSSGIVPATLGQLNGMLAGPRPTRLMKLVGHEVAVWLGVERALGPTRQGTKSEGMR